MSDYIKREDALDVVKYYHGWCAAYEGIRQMPSADVAPVRRGRWEVIDAEEPRRYGCSMCRRLSWYMDNYCPNCGSIMYRYGDEDDD